MYVFGTFYELWRPAVGQVKVLLRHAWQQFDDPQWMEGLFGTNLNHDLTLYGMSYVTASNRKTIKNWNLHGKKRNRTGSKSMEAEAESDATTTPTGDG